MADAEARELFDRLIRIMGMGEIRAWVVLENGSDVFLNTERKLPKAKIRRVKTEAIVDTGAVMILLPQDFVEKLGLRKIRKAIVTLANDQKIELDLAGPLLLTIGDRQMTTDCLVGPPGCTPLLGQIVLESLDLIPDPAKRTITPRPESPFLPTLNMKSGRLRSDSLAACLERPPSAFMDRV
ncbi:MAG: aspartyl protease family protein [Elusimicrobia bacterium]|nr:aspartyl protease family protein [Elusimicrobiota bacterium]